LMTRVYLLSLLLVVCSNCQSQAQNPDRSQHLD